MARNNAVREVERGEILRFLAEINFRPATFATLLAYLDHRALSITSSQLAFHLRYLAGKGFVEITNEPKSLGQCERILIAKITPAGIDLLDQRRAGDSGVKF